MKLHHLLASLLVFALLLSPMTTGASAAPLAAGGVTRQIRSAGTSSPETGDFTASGDGDVTQTEFPGQTNELDVSSSAYPGSIVNRSLSTGAGQGASVSSVRKAKSNPIFNVGFEGLNSYQQRFARGGNQLSFDVPDQGLCVGNGYVLEVVGNVLNIYSPSGQSLLPDNTATNIVLGFPRDVNHAVDLNSFYGYAPTVNRATAERGPSVNDPTCLYDATTQRFFVVAFTFEVKPTAPNIGAFLGPNHLDIAVSNTSNPTGSWTIYHVPVQDDGTDGTPDHHCAPEGQPPTYQTNPNACVGDYPHIGADAYGFYISTNEYQLFGSAFIGAQIYAFSKSQLAAGAASVTMVQIDTTGMVNALSPVSQVEAGFTVWPAQSPGAGAFNLNAAGTEYFLSSNAAAEAAGAAFTGSSTDLIVWTLTNTSSLDSASPALTLNNKVVTVGQYGVPPAQKQPGTGTPATINTPLGYCINDTTTLLSSGQTGCWRLATANEPAHSEVIARLDSNDSRMQQVMYANGKLWGALDTALNPEAGPQRAGIGWYILLPDKGKVVLQGYLGAAGYDLTYPAIGVTASGRGVMAFTANGDNLYPSAAFAPIDALAGVSTWNVVDGGLGAAPADGQTGYHSCGCIPASVMLTARWGDFGAAAVDGNSVWIGSEYIAHACDYTTWGGPFFAGGSGDNLVGTCGGPNHGPGVRAPLDNWSTRITQVTP